MTYCRSHEARGSHWHGSGLPEPRNPVARPPAAHAATSHLSETSGSRDPGEADQAHRNVDFRPNRSRSARRAPASCRRPPRTRRRPNCCHRSRRAGHAVRRRRGVDHGCVEHDHHLCDADDRDDEPAARIGRVQGSTSELPRICRSSIRTSPSASICPITPNTADESSSGPVRTVSPPCTSATISGNADRAVGPSRPLTRIVYSVGGVVTRISSSHIR
jgi:hypothetical protein